MTVWHHSHVGDTSMYYSDNTFTMYNLTFPRPFKVYVVTPYGLTVAGN